MNNYREREQMTLTATIITDPVGRPLHVAVGNRCAPVPIDPGHPARAISAALAGLGYELAGGYFYRITDTESGVDVQESPGGFLDYLTRLRVTTLGGMPRVMLDTDLTVHILATMDPDDEDDYLSGEFQVPMPARAAR